MSERAGVITQGGGKGETNGGAAQQPNAHAPSDTPAEKLAAGLAGVLMLSEDAILLLDENYRIWQISPVAETLFGYLNSEVIDRPVEILLTAESYDALQPTLNDLLSAQDGSRPARLHGLRGVRKGGGEVMLDAQVAKTSAAGRALFILRLHDARARTLTERERDRLADQLDVERAHLDAVLQQIPVGLFMADAPGGRLILGNKQAEQIWRQPFIPADNIVQYGLYKGFHADGRPYEPEEWPLARSITTGEVVVGEEIDFLAGDGSRRVMSVSSGPIRDREGRIVAGITTFYDVTEQNQSERALHKALSRTRELYEVSQRIGLVRAPDDVLEALLSNTFLIDCNRATILVFDRSWAEGGDSPRVVEVFADWTEQPNAVRSVGRRMPVEGGWLRAMRMRTGPLFVSDIALEAQLPLALRELLMMAGTRGLAVFPLTAGGAWFGLLSFHFPQPELMSPQDMRHIRGLVDQAAVAIHNIRLLAEEARARHEAEQANQLRLKFLAMISHELRTPLTSIKGFATTLLANDVSWDEPTQRDFIEIINVEADKLTEMIDQLLDLSRLEAGLLRITPEHRMLSDAVALAMPQLRELTQQHVFDVQAPKDLPLLRIDRHRIAQVLSNLVGNSAKFSPQQTRITVAARRADGFVQVDVSDEGAGIDPEDRPRLFEAFRRGEDAITRRTKGAGLGLAICKGLVEAHGGRIWIQDREGPGTTVSFTLPVV